MIEIFNLNIFKKKKINTRRFTKTNFYPFSPPPILHTENLGDYDITKLEKLT